MLAQTFPIKGCTLAETWLVYIVGGGLVLLIGFAFGREFEAKSRQIQARETADTVARLAKLDAIASAYAALLEEGDHLIPASRLPAPVSEIKEAIQARALSALLAGKLDEVYGRMSYREACTSSYSMLACVAPDDVAQRVNRFYRFIREHSAVPTDTERALADAVLEHAPLPSDREFDAATVAEMGRLIDEFREYLLRAERYHTRQGPA